jgi:hypothetical protein
LVGLALDEHFKPKRQMFGLRNPVLLDDGQSTIDRNRDLQHAELFRWARDDRAACLANLLAFLSYEN